MFKNFNKKTIFRDRDAAKFWHYYISQKILCQALRDRIKINKDSTVLITGTTGCLSEDTVVAGQTKTIGELYRSGNRIIETVSMKKSSTAKSGSYYPIKSKSEIFDSGFKDVYEIELKDGRKIFATDDHKLFKMNKYKIIEEEVKNLIVGDVLRCYPYKSFWKKQNEYHKTRRKKKIWNPKSKCKKCGMLFFQEEIENMNRHFYCKSCNVYKKCKRDDGWFEWEDNLLRQFYYDCEQDYILELLPLRKSWNIIQKRAHRLKIKRKGEFQYKNSAFSSLNNPMYNEEYKKKASLSLKNGHKNGHIKISGIALKSIKGLTKKENHPNWLGGISFEPYSSNWDIIFKNIIRERDEYICEICKKYGKVVHHIDYNKKNTTERNCITLCKSCHPKTNYNRAHWKKKFEYIMISKYGELKCIQ